MPPAPSRAMISKLPRRAPDESIRDGFWSRIVAQRLVATRAWKDFVTELVNDPEKQAWIADAISQRPELLFKAAEHAIGKPRQTLEVASGSSWIWTPPARADEPISVRSGTLVMPPGSHIHEG